MSHLEVGQCFGPPWGSHNLPIEMSIQVFDFLGVNRVQYSVNYTCKQYVDCLDENDR